MNDVPRETAATTCDWADLVEELDRWEAAGRVATLWWRDDDAVQPSACLADLLHVAGDVPIGLAVIPAGARRELSGALPPSVSMLQHGWLHANHAVAGKKSEYPAGRDPAIVAAEIGAGAARLRALFGERALPIFVPPWNRFSADFLSILSNLGLVKLSGMAPRQSASGAVNSIRLDVHVDLTAWKQDREFVGTAQALDRLVERLRELRLAGYPCEPTGLLTHHLVMDGPTRSFLERLLHSTRSHGAVRWASPAEFIA